MKTNHCSISRFHFSRAFALTYSSYVLTATCPICLSASLLSDGACVLGDPRTNLSREHKGAVATLAELKKKSKVSCETGSSEDFVILAEHAKAVMQVGSAEEAQSELGEVGSTGVRFAFSCNSSLLSHKKRPGPWCLAFDRR